MNVDGNTRDRTETKLKVTVGPTVARNVNGRFRERSKVDERSCCRTESLRKVPRPHIKSRGRTESSRKLMECPIYARKVDGWSSDTGNVDGKSRISTES